MKPFQLILADPGWSYRDSANAGKRGATHKYTTTPTKDLVRMGRKIEALSAPDSVLLLWATWPLIIDAMSVMSMWGFEYRTAGFLWVKPTKKGTIFMGMGHHTRGNTEPCLLGVRGRGLPRIDKGVSQVIWARRREHSRKPDQIFERADRMYGSKIRRLEMFARVRRPGWHAWGDECAPSRFTLPLGRISP